MEAEWRRRVAAPCAARQPGRALSRGDALLDKTGYRSLYVLMVVETLKDALSAGWRVHARCIGGQVDYTRSRAKCRYQAELSLETLVWTRGCQSARKIDPLSASKIDPPEVVHGG